VTTASAERSRRASPAPPRPPRRLGRLRPRAPGPPRAGSGAAPGPAPRHGSSRHRRQERPPGSSRRPRAAIQATYPITGACDGVSIPTPAPAASHARRRSPLSSRTSPRCRWRSRSTTRTRCSSSSRSPARRTSVVLMNRSGTRGHAVRQVFGRTPLRSSPFRASTGAPPRDLDPLDRRHHPARRDASSPGAPDRARRAAGRRRPIARTAIVPTRCTARPLRLLLHDRPPALQHGRAGAQSANIRLRSASGAQPDRSVTVTVPPLGTRVLRCHRRRLPDLGLRTALHRRSPGSPFGQPHRRDRSRWRPLRALRPAVSATAGVTLVTPALTLLPHLRGGTFRVNVGATEMTGAAVTAELTIRDARGSPRRGSLPGTSFLRGADQRRLRHVGSRSCGGDDRIEVRVVAGAGRIVPYATPSTTGRTTAPSWAGPPPRPTSSSRRSPTPRASSARSSGPT